MNRTAKLGKFLSRRGTDKRIFAACHHENGLNIWIHVLDQQGPLKLIFEIRQRPQSAYDDVGIAASDILVEQAGKTIHLYIRDMTRSFLQ